MRLLNINSSLLPSVSRNRSADFLINALNDDDALFVLSVNAPPVASLQSCTRWVLF